MQTSDARDIRDYCGDVENFLVIDTLIKLDEHGFHGTDKTCLRNAKLEDGSANIKEQATR